MLNGAEPISPKTMERFAQTFATLGLRREALAPVYGLAESAVGLAFPPLQRGPLFDRIDRRRLERDGLAVPANSDANAIVFVACGQPLRGHEIRVVDASGAEMPERTEGRLEFRGPSATDGYFENPAKSAALVGPEGWLDSGDRGYIAGGDVYVTGRIKDIIIRAGRNVYPHELEEVVGGIDGVRKGCVVAFASPDPQSGTERLVVVAETRATQSEIRERLKQAITAVAGDVLSVAPDEVILAAPQTVPKTSSGKIRRSASRILFEQGAFETVKRGAHIRPLWRQLLHLWVSGTRQRLRRAVRLIGTWMYGAWWWVAMFAVAAPAWLTIVLAPSRRAGQVIARVASRTFLWLVGMRVEVESDSPHGDRTVVVSNHASYLDALVLIGCLPGEKTFTAKAALETQIVAGLVLKRLGTLFVRHAQSSVAAAEVDAMAAAVRAGARLVCFPEGTLTRMPGLLAFRLGPFQAATEADVPVVPVAIRGTRTALRGEQWLPRRSKITVWVGGPLSPRGSDFADVVRLRDRAREQILAHCGEPDLSGEHIKTPL